ALTWNTAELDVQVQASVANQASFEVAQALFVLDTFKLAPGQTFNVTIRVWNTTGDRAIEVSNDPAFSGVSGIVTATNTSGTVVIPAGSYRDMVWEVQVLDGISNYLGQTHTVTMHLYGEGVGPVAQDVNFR